MDRPPYNEIGLTVGKIHSMLALAGKRSPPLQSLFKSHVEPFALQSTLGGRKA
jgi:hypothetical protein